MALASVDADTKMFWIYMTYLGSAPSSVAWLSFALEMTGQQRILASRVYRLIWLWPALLLAVVFTNPLHHGFWQSYRLEPGALDISVDHGPLFGLYANSSLLLGAAALLLFIVHSVYTAPFFRRRNLWLIAATVLPYVGYALHLGWFGGTIIAGVDNVPLMFAPTSVALAVAVFRYDAMDIVPLAQRLVFEGSKSPALVVDRLRELVAINPAARARWPSASVGTRLDEVLPEFSARELAESDEWEIDLASMGEAAAASYLVVVSRIGRAGDGILGHALVFVDITERKAAERARQEAVVARERFLANVSHELRTPVHGAAALMQLLMHTELSARQRGYVEQADASTRLLLSLIDDVLDHARAGSGQMALEHTRFEVAAVTERLLSIHSVLAAERGLTLRIEAPHIPPILGDSLRLTQVLSNLVSNGIKFTEHGHVALDITVVARGDNWVRLGFEVSDTGIGIAEDRIDTLFDAFRQADSSTTRRFGGSGLGLTIARALVRAMGGDIEVRSRLGAGSTFRLELRFESGVTTAATEPPAVFDLRGIRVLVVDDTPTNLEVIEGMLEDTGAQVVASTSGARALDIARDTPFDLILLDLYMPIVDGFATARRLRMLSGYGQVPIVGMTASVLRQDRDRASAAGMTGFIAKPFTGQQLQEVIGVQLELPGKAAADTLDTTRHSAFGSRSRPADAGAHDDRRRRLRAGLMDDARASLDELSGCVDLERVSAVAHRIAGAAALLGETALAAAASTVEHAAQTADADKAPRALLELDGTLATMQGRMRG